MSDDGFQQNKWTMVETVKRFDSALMDWLSHKPTGELIFKIEARTGGINKVLISSTVSMSFVNCKKIVY